MRSASDSKGSTSDCARDRPSGLVSAQGVSLNSDLDSKVLPGPAKRDHRGSMRPTSICLLLAVFYSFRSAEAQTDHDDHDGHSHGDEGGSFEWAGIFETPLSTYLWTAQKVDGAYVDPAMKLVALPATTLTQQARLANHLHWISLLQASGVMGFSHVETCCGSLRDTLTSTETVTALTRIERFLLIPCKPTGPARYGDAGKGSHGDDLHRCHIWRRYDQAYKLGSSRKPQS